MKFIPKKKPEKESSEPKRSKEEQQRIDDIIENHLISLDKQLKEKELFGFWVFPDLKGFKKINKINSDGIQFMINKDVDKYKNRKIAKISICTNHKDKTQFMFRQGIWMTANITIYQIDENGILKGKKNPDWGCDIGWKEQDFKVSKISFKLLETLMRITSDKKHECYGTGGVPLSKIVEQLKKKKIDISDVLNPLAGI